MIGERFGRLVVVRGRGKDRGHLMWECACDCGGVSVSRGTDLRSGNTESCGCLRGQSATALWMKRNGVLTKRQLEVLQAIADGETVPQIARREQRSVSTIESVLQRARVALRGKTTTHAVAAALRWELIA